MTKLQFLLTKLAEECNEVAQMALKSQQFGLTEKRDVDGPDNKARLHAELNDLNAIVWMLNSEFGFGYLPNKKALLAKGSKVEKYLGYSILLGMVNET